MSTVDKSMPVIAMDHQPFELKQAADAGVDLLLSGHTHGTNGTKSYCNEKNVRTRLGLRTKGAFHAIVSSGFGFWGPPLRLGSRSRLYRWKLRLNSRIKGQLITVGPFLFSFSKIICVRLYI